MSGKGSGDFFNQKYRDRYEKDLYDEAYLNDEMRQSSFDELQRMRRNEAVAALEKDDLAGSRKYEKRELNFDDAELRRRRWGFWLAIVAYIFMGVVSAFFFFLAGYAGWEFISHSYDQTGDQSADARSFIIQLVPLIPGALSSLTGLLVLITAARFTQAYFGSQQDNQEDEQALLGQLVRDVVAAVRSGKGG